MVSDLLTRDVYVGIDVAFAKKKRLPVSVCELLNDRLTPLSLRTDFEKPPAGSGNKAALQGTVRKEFAAAVSDWLKLLAKKNGLRIRRIAIDAPSDYCSPSLARRLSEQSLDQSGISCFATPTKLQFDEKIRVSLAHLATGGAEATMPNANQIWMLVGFELFTALKSNGFECIETYPQAIVHELNCSAIHKSTNAGFMGQIASAAHAAGYSSKSEFETKLNSMGYGSRHDKLDAFLSAWVASLPAGFEKVFGSRPNDAIIVPDAMKIQKAKLNPGVPN